MTEDNKNTLVSPVFAQAVEKNEWVFTTVQDRTRQITLKQEEVLYKNLDPRIRNLIYQTLEDSIVPLKNGDVDYIETGFFLAYLGNNEFDIEPVTSNDSDNIFEGDNDKALEDLLTRNDSSQIERMQYYHIHPKHGVISMTLSTGDISETNRLQKKLIEKNISCPFDMHAMPHELAYEGYFKRYIKPALGKYPYNEKGEKLDNSPPISAKTEARSSELIPVIPRIVRATLNPEQVIQEL